jgi:protein O-GlcNAc transferase
VAQAADRLHRVARLLVALDLAERGLKRRPADPICLAWRADLLRALDRPHDAAARRRGWSGPDLAEACLDPFAEIGVAAIESAALYLAQFCPAVDDRRLVEAHRAWGRRHADGLGRFEPVAVRGDRLRVGYVSADLGRHPVGRLLASTLPAHDRGTVEVHVYSDRLAEDDLTARLRATSDAWTETAALDDAALAERISRESIDVLVDLAGHSWGNRLLVFARRPAPVQVSFLGYGATTGLAAMDAVLTDPWEAPTPAHFTETVLRLPSGRLPAPSLRARPARGGPPVFGSLNKLAKLSPPVVVLWSELLQRTAGSRLLLKSTGLDEPWLRALVVAAFGEQGVEEDRLDLRGWSADGTHLSGYAAMDVALDPFPFAGGMTTCEALAAGVPVVTLPQQRPLSRQSLSLLSRVKLGDLVAGDEEAFLAIAADAVGRTLPALEPPRHQARELEFAYRQLWEKRLGSRPA